MCSPNQNHINEVENSPTNCCRLTENRERYSFHAIPVFYVGFASIKKNMFVLCEIIYIV